MTENQDIIARIRNQDNLEQALAEFVTRFPDMAVIVEALPDIPLRRRPPGFLGLAEIITAQQVSKASAAAIFERTIKAIQPFTAENFLAAGEDPLIDAGQSRAKQAALTGLARAVVEKRLDIDNLCLVSIENAIAQLTALKGIGLWTAEVFLLFCAGHLDVFPAGDVALQHAMGDICNLDTKPDTRTTRDLAMQWAPLRGVAARVLYAHYAHRRGRRAI
jgi:DNA-3-methyladenine glycosylase II